VRAGDTVARIGGDEFVMLMECETALVDPVIAARRIVESIGSTIDAGSRPIQVSCSIGIAAYPEHGPMERLIAHADAAMLEAKRAGGNTWAHFEDGLKDARPEMPGLQDDLRTAIERGQLELHYQPKVDARSGETRGVEALPRWSHPTLGMVGPATFIPLAERFGLIGRLGNWVIDEACRQVEQWAREGVRMSVTLNLPVHQLRERETRGDGRAIVSAVVHMAHDPGLGAGAEGVETPGQRDVPVNLEGDELQGCPFTRPMRGDEVLGWIRARNLEAGTEPTRMRAAAIEDAGATGDPAVPPRSGAPAAAAKSYFAT
jgi:predicted signal transduction protein with EAL and GGDEF domain